MVADPSRRDLLPYCPVRRPPLILALATALAVALCGCGSSSRSSSAAAGATPAAAAPANAGRAVSRSGCRTVATRRPKGVMRLKAPTVKLDPARTYTVRVVTNCGSFAFRLDVRRQPKTAASVYSLTKRGFYDGLTFHRVAAGFVIQGGDPLGTGAGGPGYTVVETPPRGIQYVRGDVAMAKTQVQPAGASGSQFFIVTGANVTASAGLTPDYALAGKVVSGQNVVDAIGSLPTSPPSDGTPTPAVVMSKVTVSVS
jgi:peptidyl-prolyl cis-trans isomerase B (cyclophilin B)